MTTTISGSSPSVTFSDGTTQASAGLPLTGGTLSGAVTVPTLNAPSGVLATQNGMTGIAKAWLNYNASTQTVTNSFNVSSVTYNGTGDFTVNFTTAMASSTYSVVSGGYNVSGSTLTSTFVSNLTAPTTALVRITTRDFANGNNNSNPALVFIAIFGA